MRTCAFLTMDSLDGFVTYDHLTIDPLAALGWRVEMVSWRDGSVDWDRYDACVIRSPWDYQDDPDAFLAVLETIDASRARLENELALVTWNLHKSYLRDLEARGVAVVPTLWGKAPAAAELASLHARLGSDRVVVKPPVSANADDTFVLGRDDDPREVLACFRDREFMAQPFLDAVIDEGEFSLFLFNGAYSHAVLKRPKAGDFRVQEEHGGQIAGVQPEAALRAAAGTVMAALDREPLYARADFIRDDGRFLLIELELIEPSLYFDFDPESPRRFAEAFAHRMAT